MSYLDKYKVGAPLVRTLSEGRSRWNALRNAIRYSHPAPTSIIGVRDYLKTAGSSCRYEKRSEASELVFPQTDIEPEAARPLLEKTNRIEFPESFVLRVPDGRVLGDGTVVVAGNSILAESTTDFHRKQEHHYLLNERRVSQPERFDGRLAVITSPGSDNYFHGTLDSVPRVSLLAGLEDEIDGYYIDSQSRFHQEWLGMLGIPENKIVSASPERHIEAKELIVPSFAGVSGLPSMEGLNFVAGFKPSTTNRDRRVYVSRAVARRRRIVNENELLPLLERHGFETIRPGELTVLEQMETFSSADVVVSAHGAELTNLAYCGAGAKVIELFSPYYLNPCFKQLAAARGLRHAALVGTGGKQILREQTDAHHVWANIRIDLLKLKTTLATMLPSRAN